MEAESFVKKIHCSTCWRGFLHEFRGRYNGKMKLCKGTTADPINFIENYFCVLKWERERVLKIIITNFSRVSRFSYDVFGLQSCYTAMTIISPQLLKVERGNFSLRNAEQKLIKNKFNFCGFRMRIPHRKINLHAKLLFSLFAIR